MKILLTINADTLLQGYEALAMAFALAVFEHEVQLVIEPSMLAQVLAQPTGKLANMLGSLALYDMPTAWLASADWATLTRWRHAEPRQDFDWLANVAPMPTHASDFDMTLRL